MNAQISSKQQLRKPWAHSSLAYRPPTRCFVGKLPAIDPALMDSSYEGVEKQTATSKKPPFINAPVAGTGLEPVTFGL
jgi:hypothetical protein